MAPKQKRYNLYGGHDPRLAPAYSFAEAAHYLRLPVQTLRNWSLGFANSEPLFVLDDPQREHLSFWNLVEGHVLAGMRRQHGLRLGAVRAALEYVRSKLQVSRPLIDQQFETDGRSLLVELYQKTLDASRQGQLVMDSVLLSRLKRIDRDFKGLPIALYPITRRDQAHGSESEHPKFVVVDPRISFGRPVVGGVPTSAIWDRYRAGDSMSHLAEDYGLQIEEVEEAIRCEAA